MYNRLMRSRIRVVLASFANLAVEIIKIIILSCINV